jgi:hypothetical protein
MIIEKRGADAWHLLHNFNASTTNTKEKTKWQRRNKQQPQQKQRR